MEKEKDSWFNIILTLMQKCINFFFKKVNWVKSGQQERL